MQTKNVVLNWINEGNLFDVSLHILGFLGCFTLQNMIFVGALKIHQTPSQVSVHFK